MCSDGGCVTIYLFNYFIVTLPPNLSILWENRFWYGRDLRSWMGHDHDWFMVGVGLLSSLGSDRDWDVISIWLWLWSGYGRD